MTTAQDQIIGEAMHAATVAQISCLAMVSRGVVPREKMSAAIDVALHKWEELLADPECKIPGAMNYARQRMEEFLEKMLRLT